jgi:hypothetical protein
MPDCSSCRQELPPGSVRCPACGTAVDPAPADRPSDDADVAGDRSNDGEDAVTVLPSTPRAAVVRSTSPGLGCFSSNPGAEFPPGTLLADRYRIIALLGRGGMGEVYRADDLRLGQPVALKFLPPALERDHVRLERFLAEVRTARQVSHPNVCRVYDLDEVAGRHFLSMEYIDGEDLASLLRRIGRLPVDKATDIARQLCAALAAAHDKGVLHRDLKPANVMLDGRGKVRLTDFGLALRLADGLEPARSGQVAGAGQDVGEVSGTPAYMAPEQFAGRPATVQSDLYALGLVLYEVFGGRRAFEAGTIAELRRLHEKSRAEQLSSSVRDLEPAIERVIFRCLEKDPANRPASAIAVAAALPGGDPLAAALAAGETPSPEMVAASGEAGVMSPGVAAAWLAVVLIALVAVVLLATGRSALSMLPLDDPPDVTRFKAREALDRLGYGSVPADTAHGYQWDADYLNWVTTRNRSADRWAPLRTGHLLLQSWHRESPAPMVPTRFLGGRLIEGGNVRSGDPPRDVPGMLFVVMDVRGRLLRLEAVPPSTEPEAATAATDWAPVLALTGVDASTLSPTEPRWTPPVYADQRAAWQGRYPDLPDIEVRIEAAAHRGKPVYLRVVMPWTRPPGAATPRSPAETATQVLGLTVLVSVLIGAVVFARRNVRLGRGDRRGATRLAGAVAGVILAVLLLEAHHVSSADEVVLLLRAVCWTLFGGAFTWALYLALEPPIRRRWPRTLVGWNRILTGRFTDPLVGRDLLVGSAAGAVVAVVAQIQGQYWRAAGGLTPEPGLGLIGPLTGFRISASWFLLEVFDAVFSALALFFLVFLLRLVLRKDWLAAGAWVCVSIAQNVLASTDPWVTAAFAGIVVSSLMVLLFRSGLLSFCVAVLFVDVLGNFPLTTHVQEWYGTGTVVAVVGLLFLAGYGFRTALAGKPLLGAAVD